MDKVMHIGTDVIECKEFGKHMHSIARTLVYMAEDDPGLAATYTEQELKKLDGYFASQLKLADTNSDKLRLLYEKHRGLLRQAFTPSPSALQRCNEFFDRVKISPDSDYISLCIFDNGGHSVQHDCLVYIDYYRNCLAQLPDNLPVIVNFVSPSNCEMKKYKAIFSGDRFIFCELDCQYALPIISGAKHCILSNHSMFWWGAFLGSKAKTVFYPDPWNRHALGNLRQARVWFPSDWIPQPDLIAKHPVPPLTGTSIKDVTLILIEGNDLKRGLESLNKSISQVKFDNVLFLTCLETNHPKAVKIPKMDTIEEYSSFIVQKLYTYFNTSHCLITQHDGWIVDGSKWTNEFLKYDYVGCNTLWTGWGQMNKGGNGGFSLRSRRLLEYAAKYGPLNHHPEDMYFSHNWFRPFFEKAGFYFATKEVQDKFGHEYSCWNGQFGHHRALLHYLKTGVITEQNMDKDKIYYGCNGSYIECTDLLKKHLTKGLLNKNDVLDKLVGDPYILRSKNIYYKGRIYGPGATVENS